MALIAQNNPTTLERARQKIALLGVITDKEHDVLGEEITKAWNG